MNASKRVIGLIVAGVLVCGAGAVRAESEAEEGGGVQGYVDVLYRNVDVDGSQQKYNEDFDGLSSGARIGEFWLNWDSAGSKFLDYARLGAIGLGGDPFESLRADLGRKDKYDLSVRWTKQQYLYNLFPLNGDLDASTWDTRRQATDLTLNIYPTKKIKVFVNYHNNLRDGNSLFMKDVTQELYQMNTPVDIDRTDFSVGAQFRLGRIDLVVRQTHRDYMNNFNNSTSNNLGLTGGTGLLNDYEWMQTDDSAADITEVRLHAPITRKLNINVGYQGTLVGEEDLDSNVLLNADGVDQTGTPFTITDGTSAAEINRDTQYVDADLSWTIIAPVTLHVEFRGLDQQQTGQAQIDLSATGTPTTVDTTIDWKIYTTTGLIELRPLKSLTLIGGYRLVDRELTRNGFDPIRDVDFESDGDESVVLSFDWRPIKLFRLDGSYEDGSIDRPFTAVSAFDTQRTRVRAAVTPRNLRFDISYIDSENTNNFDNGVTTPNGHRAENQSISAGLWHQPTRMVRYELRYTDYDVESVTDVMYDGAGFLQVLPGQSIYMTDNQSFFGRVDVNWARRWSAYARYQHFKADGANPLIDETTGTEVTCLAGVTEPSCNSTISQKLTDGEIGLRYTFDSGVFVGGEARLAEYTDVNTLLDYEAAIYTLRLGTTF